MYKDHRIAALLLMGGQGTRFGGPIPKQFVSLNGKKIFAYALDTMAKSGLFDEILLVCHKDWLNEGFPERAIEGGESRQESCYKGLRGLAKKPDIVLIHDAVRPFVTEEILRENVEGAIRFGAVDTCTPSADTLVYAPDGEKISTIPKRADFLRGQTPQTFRYDWILEAHEKAGIENSTDDCQLVMNLGKPVYVVRGAEHNFKITTEFDLFLAEQSFRRGLVNKFLVQT